MNKKVQITKKVELKLNYVVRFAAGKRKRKEIYFLFFLKEEMVVVVVNTT
jgi:hypothetical protein